MAAAIVTLSAKPIQVTPEPAAAADPSISFVSGDLKTAAVSDRYNLLIAGGVNKLVVFPLQADGTPVNAPIQTLDLTLPASLKTVANHPLWITFHPLLPLVYVWQDITSKFLSNPEGYQDLAHLAIYRINGKQLQLVGTYAKGDDFVYGQSHGSIGVTQNAKHILLPNTYLKDAYGIGSFELTEAGLPVVNAGKTDPEVALMRMSNTVPTSMGMIIGPNGLLISGYADGALTTDLEVGHVLGMKLGLRYDYMAGGNDKNPVFYFMGMRGGMLVSIEQVDGYLTQLPRTLTFGGNWSSPPVAMNGQHRLAVGGTNLLLLIDLDTDGWPLAKARTIPLEGAPTQITYSGKFNRLYVPVN